MPLPSAIPLVTTLSVLLACAGGAESPGPEPAAAEAPAGVTERRTLSQDAELPPAGYGTLKQDEVSVALRDGDLLIKVTPLAESVIRLTAPDTYDRLHGLAGSRRARLEREAMVEDATLFLISFFSYAPNVTFQPEDVQIVNQGRRYRSLAIVPVTPGWGAQRLDQQQTQMGIYAFAPGIVLDRPMTVEYQSARNSSWQRIVSALEEEEAKVRARAGSDPGA